MSDGTKILIMILGLLIILGLGHIFNKPRTKEEVYNSCIFENSYRTPADQKIICEPILQSK